MEKFDAIVIGAGPAGAAAAYTMAKAGLGVLIVERGKFPGSKNVSGGILYSKILNDLIPSFWEEAPVERHITNHAMVFLSGKTAFAMRFDCSDFGMPPYNSFSIHRAKFDKWFANKAEEAGATLVTGIRVDNLLKEYGRIIGIKSGSDELMADVVIAADGAKSLIAEKAGLRRDFFPKQIGVGIKEIVELPTNTIEERFNLHDSEGVAYTLIGNTNGTKGGGFLYTNKDSISIGLVLNMQSIIDRSEKTHELIEQYRSHPFIEKLIRGGKIMEYSTQIVHEGGFDLIPPLYADGFLLTGSAAGFVLNNGFTLRGIDFAVASGIEAGRTAIKAKQNNDFSQKILSLYEQYLKIRFVLKDLKAFRRMPGFLYNDRLYTTYPDIISLTLKRLYTTDYETKRFSKAARESVKNRIRTSCLLRDAVEVLRAV